MARAGSKRKSNPKNSVSQPVAKKDGASSQSTKNPEDLECAVCTDLYKDPRLLNCMHSFCSICIEQMQKHADQQDVECPICRFVTKAGNDGSLHLLRNHILEQKIKWFKVSREKAHQCTDCASEKATGLCTTCQFKLCNFCMSHHKRSLRFKDHNIQSIEDVSNEDLIDKQPIQCPAHKQELKYYCQPCEATICVDCMLSKDHQGHVFVPLSEVMEKEVETFKSSIDDADTALLDYKSYLGKVVQFQKESVEHRNASKKLIGDSYDELIVTLQSEKQTLLNWLDRWQAASVDVVRNLEGKIAHTLKMTNHMKEVLKHPAAEIFDVISGASQLKENIQCIKSVNKSKGGAPSAMVFTALASQPRPVNKNSFDVELLARQMERRVPLEDIKASLRNIRFNFAFKECYFGESPGVCTFTVRDASKVMLSVASQPITHCNFLWRIKVLREFKVQNGKRERGLGIFIQCDPREENPSWVCKARCQITFTSLKGVDRSISTIPARDFCKGSNEWGSFLTWKNLTDVENGYIKEDSFTITAYIWVEGEK